jgi:plasmid maintenance system killer protein
MILGYRDKRTRAFAYGQVVRQFSGFSRQASKRLEILEAAGTLDDLRGLSSNHFEALKGAGKVNLVSGSICNGGYASSGVKGRRVRRTCKS